MRYCQEKGIVCQYAGTNMHCCLTACVFPREDESLYKVIYDSTPKELTVDQVSKLLGYKVKVVGSDQ